MSGSLYLRCAVNSFFVVAATAHAVLGVSPAVSPRQCTFSYYGARVGDIGSQSVDVTLDATRTIQQAGNDISTSALRIERRQHRDIRIVHVEGKVATHAQVAFPLARQVIQSESQPDIMQEQAIQGKRYDVARTGEVLEVRSVTNEPVTDDERILVESAMSSLGRPHPIGVLLDQRTLTVGESVSVPADQIANFLGMQTAADSQLHLRLTDIKGTPDRPVALFSAVMASRSPDGTTIQVKGTWAINPASCQTISADFRGPVQSTEQHGPVGAQFLIRTNGQLQLQMQRREGTKTARRDTTSLSR